MDGKVLSYWTHFKVVANSLFVSGYVVLMLTMIALASSNSPSLDTIFLTLLLAMIPGGVIFMAFSLRNQVVNRWAHGREVSSACSIQRKLSLASRIVAFCTILIGLMLILYAIFLYFLEPMWLRNILFGLAIVCPFVTFTLQTFFTSTFKEGPFGALCLRNFLNRTEDDWRLGHLNQLTFALAVFSWKLKKYARVDRNRLTFAIRMCILSGKSHYEIPLRQIMSTLESPVFSVSTAITASLNLLGAGKIFLEKGIQQPDSQRIPFGRLFGSSTVSSFMLNLIVAVLSSILVAWILLVMRFPRT